MAQLIKEEGMELRGGSGGRGLGLGGQVRGRVRDTAARPPLPQRPRACSYPPGSSNMFHVTSHDALSWADTPLAGAIIN